MPVDNPREPILILCLFLFVAAVYSPVIFTSYAFQDDYPILCAAIRHEVCGFDITKASVGGGRPLSGLGYILSFKAMHSIGDLRWLRTASVVGIAAVGIASYRALKGKDLPPSVVLAFPLLVAFMPPFQVYAAWATAFLFPWSALLAGVAFTIITPELPGPLPWRRWAAAVGILTASLAITQYAAMMFWLFAGIAWLAPPKAPDRQDVVRAGVVMGVALVADYALAKGLSLLLYDGYTNPRTAIVTDIHEKIIWFLNEPLVNALNLPLIVPRHVIAYAMLAFITTGLWLYLPGSTIIRLRRVALAVILVPLAYLPNLLVAESLSTYRTQIALTSLILFYAVIALVGWLRFLRLQRVLLACLVIAVITCAGLANRNMILEFVLPQVLEYRIAGNALRKINFEEAKGVYFIPADLEFTLAPVKRYNEFGWTSLAHFFVPQAMAWLILKETHSPFADLVFSRSAVLVERLRPPPRSGMADATDPVFSRPALGSAPPGSIVIDFGKVLRE